MKLSRIVSPVFIAAAVLGSVVLPTTVFAHDRQWREHDGYRRDRYEEHYYRRPSVFVGANLGWFGVDYDRPDHYRRPYVVEERPHYWHRDYRYDNYWYRPRPRCHSRWEW